MTGEPVVASIVPTWQEERHIEKCLRSLMCQTYPATSHRIMVLDGGSSDGTLAIAKKLAKESSVSSGPEIIVLNNPDRFVPQARNLALKEAEDDVDFFFEMNGHAYVPEDHLQKRLKDLLELESELGREVAGIGTRVRLESRGQGVQAGWVAAAMTSPFGSGGGQFAQFSGRSAHKIPSFVIHRRKALESVGGWNTQWRTNQDSDLSMRLIKSGWPLYRSDISHLTLSTRSTLLGFARMMFRYGAWRGRSLWSHPTRANPSEFMPLLGLLILGTLLFLAQDLADYPVLMYAAVLFAVGLFSMFRTKRVTHLIGVPLGLLILHTFFTAGLVLGALRLPVGAHDR